MKLAAFQKCSLVDYPGRVAAVVFTPGCNMSCHYCHNQALLGPEASRHLTDPAQVLTELARRARLLDGLVVTGGEPTLQDGLDAFLREVRALGLAVKLDTNGTRPDVLARLLDCGLPDFVAMDLKAPWERYEEICGASVDLDSIARSVELLRNGSVEHEFRTTFSPQLTGGDVEQLATLLQGGASRLVLQQYRLPPNDRTAAMPALSHPPEYIREVARSVRGMAVECHTRGV